MPLTLVLLIASAFVVRLFSPGSSTGIPVAPGPLSGLGTAGEIIALLITNLVIAVLTMVVVASAARRSRNQALRAVSAVEPVPAGQPGK